MTYSSSTSDENGNYAFNTMANHSCDTGFGLVGNNTRTCTGDGSSTTGVFDGEAAICKRKLTQNIIVNTSLIYSFIHECHAFTAPIDTDPFALFHYSYNLSFLDCSYQRLCDRQFYF